MLFSNTVVALPETLTVPVLMPAEPDADGLELVDGDVDEAVDDDGDDAALAVADVEPQPAIAVAKSAPARGMTALCIRTSFAERNRLVTFGL